MILPPHEVTIVVERIRQTDFVAHVEQNSALRMTGLINVFRCISGLAFTSVRLTHWRMGLSLKAKG